MRYQREIQEADRDAESAQTMTDHPFTQRIEQMVLRLPSVTRLWVAYSGGVDSTVLLHAALPLAGRWKLGVIHVNHQISSNAAAWQKHCEETASDWGVQECVSEFVQVQDAEGGVEQGARDARYQVFARHMQAGDLLLMAHHLHDQSETFFLRLLRGAGLTGLGAMPALRAFSSGYLARPFLHLSKPQILAYARRHQLSWMDDDSNQSTAFDRNFLRLEVLPRLRTRWPRLDDRVASAAERLQQANTLLSEYLVADLTLLEPRRERVGSSVMYTPLRQFSTAKSTALIRHWIENLGYRGPSQLHSDEIANLLTAKPDASPLLNLRDCEIRRYQNRMYCLPSGWREQLDFPTTVVEDLRPTAERGNALCLHWQSDQWGFIPQANDKCLPLASYCGPRRAHPHYRAHSQTLKKLFQECAVAPWLRPQWPVIVRDDQLICAVGLWVEKRYAVADEHAGFPDWFLPEASPVS